MPEPPVSRDEEQPFWLSPYPFLEPPPLPPPADEPD